ILEYLVNISKRRAFWSLNEDILKINDSDNQYAVSIKEDTAYPCLHSPKTTKETSSIRRWTIQTLLWRNTSGSKEKAQKRGKVFNWETTKYGKIWYDEDIHDLRSVENEFPAIAFNNEVSSEKTLSCEPMVSSLNDEIDFRISFDDSDDEDYTTSLSKCDEEEQNILNFNDLFPFNVIYPNDSKSDKDNDDDKFDIDHSSGDLSVKPLPDVINTDVGAYAYGSNKLLETRPRERNIDEYWWRIYKYGDLEVLES
ncbi:hypothetical protein Tco_0361422, partial [Tanacetum coccineum]